MCDEVETVKRFCYLGDRLNASGTCETAVTARTRVGWKKFRECGEIMFRKRFSLRMNEKLYNSYGSKTWYVRENEAAILRTAKRSMVRGMCGVNLMDMLGLKEAAHKLARANGVRWYGHVLRRPEQDVLMKAMVYKWMENINRANQR